MTLPELLIKRSFKLAVMFIESFHDMGPYEQRVKALHQMEEGSLGKDIAIYLEQNNLRLVPGFESHDLKHVLLGFEMTPVDEIRMQAFMLGNGNISLPSILIFLYGFILLPYKWLQFYKDMKAGYMSLPIKNWTIEGCAHLNTQYLRVQVIGKRQRSAVIPRLASFAAIVAGIFGMVFCLPFLFSDRLEDLVGAGFPFVGGAILFSAGLISLSLMSRRKMVSMA